MLFAMQSGRQAEAQLRAENGQFIAELSLLSGDFEKYKAATETKYNDLLLENSKLTKEVTQTRIEQDRFNPDEAKLLAEVKKSLEDEKKRLAKEKKSLADEKKLLAKEKKSLDDKKKSLEDRENILAEKKKANPVAAAPPKKRPRPSLRPIGDIELPSDGAGGRSGGRSGGGSGGGGIFVGTDSNGPTHW
jgi:hypothetical protein